MKQLKRTVTLIALLLLAVARPGYADPDLASIIKETGCESKFSDEKKADLFKTYNGKTVITSGTVEKADSGTVYLKVLPNTLTYDVQIKMADPKVTLTLVK